MPQEARLGGARDDPTGSRPAAGVRLVEWTGVIAFAATIMFVLGSFRIIEGTLALLDEEYYEVLATGSWLDSKVSEGGTGAARIEEQMRRAKEALEGIGDAKA